MNKEKIGYCPVCGSIPIIEETGLLYGEKVRFFMCNNCAAEFGVFRLSGELKGKIVENNYGELWRFGREKRGN